METHKVNHLFTKKQIEQAVIDITEIAIMAIIVCQFL